LFIPTLGLPQFVAQLLGLGLGGSFSLVCMVVPLIVVRKRVPQLGENG